eukprot:TRINITY_DN15383_c0_g1_i1.p1 TRINITY_DN15383_c0_g1~~TRINITY_DN15383_c0_g1_i1.p1  ORF type:complete len:359 (-),score=63.69 TRINITY_DN15383_c0_g1_i1:164-1240(-)
MTRVASLLINQHALLLGFAVKNTLRGSRVTRVSMSVVASAPTEVPSKFLKNKRLVPESTPPSDPDLGLLYNFVNDSKKLVVLTGAGASTECGIPDYRSPHGAYSSGFKPITHQEFVRSEKARRRYWARSYAGWQKFNSVQPGATHKALANLEKKGRVYGMITQNVDRLHQKAGSNPIELHGTTHYVVCLSCGCITDRHLFQDRVKALNPEWALAIKHLEQGTLGKDPSVGLQVRPDGDIEIDEKFWEEKFYIPSCEGCGGVLKPNVVFFGDNVPRERANQAFSIVKEGDALLVVGSSLNTMSAYRLVNAARENCLPIAILNIGQTRADKLSTIKVEAHCGEALSRLLSMGSLAVPLIK